MLDHVIRKKVEFIKINDYQAFPTHLVTLHSDIFQAKVFKIRVATVLNLSMHLRWQFAGFIRDDGVRHTELP